MHHVRFRCWDHKDKLEDRSADAIERAFSRDIPNSLDEALAIEDFIDRIGGIENARAAIETLQYLENAG
jgi:hypothetical protein